MLLSLAYSKVGKNGRAAVECVFEKIILKILRIKIQKRNWYQWTQKFPKFLFKFVKTNAINAKYQMIIQHATARHR